MIPSDRFGDITNWLKQQFRRSSSPGNFLTSVCDKIGVSIEHSDVFKRFRRKVMSNPKKYFHV